MGQQCEMRVIDCLTESSAPTLKLKLRTPYVTIVRTGETALVKYKDQVYEHCRFVKEGYGIESNRRWAVEPHTRGKFPRLEERKDKFR